MADSLLISVDGRTVKYCPSSFTYGLQDISTAESGRTQDGLMHKERVTQKVKLELEWRTKKPEVVSEILQMFNPVFVDVKYYDAKEGRAITKTFCSGDKSAPVKQWFVGGQLYERVAFNLIER